MGNYDRVDFYRKNRDYAGLLDENGGAEDAEEEEAEEVEEEDGEEYEEDDEGPGQYRRSEPDEDPEVVRERQEYLQRRQKLKELERQKLKQKLNGIYSRNDDSDSEKEKKKLPYDNYGSFFGPSQPVVARRVIEETRARLQAAKVSARVVKEVPESYAAASYSLSEEKETPVLVSETKKKAQQLKAARDYSFLFSEDAEIPGNDKGLGLGSETKTDKSSRPDHGQQKQASLKNSTSMKKLDLYSKQISSIKGGKGMVKSATQIPKKFATQKVAPSAKPRPSSDPRKQINKVGSGLSRPAIQGKGSIQCSRNNGTRVVGADSDKRKAPLINTSKAGNAELQRSAISRPIVMQKPLSSKASVQNFLPEQRKPMILAKPAPKMVNKFEAKSKPQAKPAKPLISRNLHDERPKKRPRDDEVEEDLDGSGNYRSLIRQMFGYNPNKYRNIDDDDSDMEVGFNTIQAEERRSAKIAKEEDERELALIEAEEREERLRAVKKRKLQNK